MVRCALQPLCPAWLAEYSGSTDTIYPASTSAPLSVTATTPPPPPTPTSTSLIASSIALAVSAPVTFTATISPIPDSGTVAFDDDAGTISGCATVPVDLSTGSAKCVTSLSTPGSHAITAGFSGSINGAFAASVAEAVTVSVAKPSPGVSGNDSATQTPPLSEPLGTTGSPTAAHAAAVFAVSILTREAKPLINRRVLAVRARCGAVACTLRATMTIELGVLAARSM
jgi:Bacterial Ig-like domain (group 3)